MCKRYTKIECNGLSWFVFAVAVTVRQMHNMLNTD